MSIKGDEGDIIYREHEDRRKGRQKERSVHHPETHRFPTLGATTRLRYVTPALSNP